MGWDTQERGYTRDLRGEDQGDQETPKGGVEFFLGNLALQII